MKAWACCVRVLVPGAQQRAEPDEQVATYSAIARAVGPDYNLVVRTLDVGGGKPLTYVPMEPEANPVFRHARGSPVSGAS